MKEIVEPGCRIYIMDDYGINNFGEMVSTSIEFISKPLEFESLEELKSHFVPEFMTLGNGIFGYEFAGSEAFYKYGKDFIEEYENFIAIEKELKQKLANSNERVVYTIPEPTTTHFDEIIIKYRNNDKIPIERKLDLRIRYQGGAIERPSFSTDSIEKIKIGKEEVLYNKTKRSVYYKKDGNVYQITLPYQFKKREIIQLIKSLHY